MPTATSPVHTPQTDGPTSAVDPRALRRCFGRFTTGVTVISYHVGDQIRGATVNSFTSVSLDPPLVLVSLARSTQACGAVADLPFAINVLRADQPDVAMQFAGRTRPGLRIAWDLPAGEDEPPTLADAVAVFRCRPWRRYDGGDHVLQLGEITGFEDRAGEPLVFGDGRFVSTGLPLLDGPMVFSLDGPPSPGWVGAAQRFHAMPEH
ncbi:flavin reductase (DIM6/NTAB) family NADH-FMN oxidoreductase RutF [Amycolatopsis sulphurea]|uniref:Flavin reductase (DIM6/NTAB) family NADH-FMN oxidoreductase RutF n=1 Tax=Amycolatopsis sulphurea TaxID=76022 RepID=A0A2A9FDE9_9PSEU|nr:flavin reductase family protein [Amycolatopsis sulphurea]PFG49198.1 flavin reductase (DIM6/NTAB) family NADH-FMN oxidoreductase RutF [Amycolatopsis sulphurea]